MKAGLSLRGISAEWPKCDWQGKQAIGLRQQGVVMIQMVRALAATAVGCRLVSGSQAVAQTKTIDVVLGGVGSGQRVWWSFRKTSPTDGNSNEIRVRPVDELRRTGSSRAQFKG